MNINFKRSKDEKEMDYLHPKLRKVVEFMVEYARIVLDGHVLTVTRIVDQDGSTHDQVPPYRFIDIRSLDLDKNQAEKLRNIVNLTFPYGKTSKGREGITIPPLDHAGTTRASTAEHFHVQVSAREKFG